MGLFTPLFVGEAREAARRLVKECTHNVRKGSWRCSAQRQRNAPPSDKKENEEKMQQAVLPPIPFLASLGLPPVDWEQWIEGFEAYLDAIEGDIFTQKKKLSILKHSLGVEGRKILKHLPIVPVAGEGDEIDEYGAATKVLDARLKKKKKNGAS
ncbi:hypothetical protein NDU88_010026 [Pleurodeles waltl]|uniref:Uncharacterized protein n=1 Tax=Pleurodeles waltl TaxID=8319 RepID=A0AAV7PWP2_PLEWA|nr:hypothetical protein NDU88_010026 [Pleurodeles waltl]